VVVTLSVHETAMTQCVFEMRKKKASEKKNYEENERESEFVRYMCNVVVDRFIVNNC
jgi:hypothetical protein